MQLVHVVKLPSHLHNVRMQKVAVVDELPLHILGNLAAALHELDGNLSSRRQAFATLHGWGPVGALQACMQSAKTLLTIAASWATALTCSLVVRSTASATAP